MWRSEEGGVEVEGARRGRVGMKVDGDSLHEYIS